MKKYLLVTLLATAFTFSGFAGETLQVDVTKLNPQELQLYQKLKTQAAEEVFNIENLSPERIDKYAQIGKAFGTAFKECWSTVSTDAEKFAQSGAGKWAMIMVSWKIMGKDAMNIVSQTVRFMVGGFLLMVGVPFFIYIFRRNCVQYPLLASKTKIGFLTTKKDYNGVNKPIHGDIEAWAYPVCFGVFLGICALIMFT